MLVLSHVTPSRDPSRCRDRHGAHLLQRRAAPSDRQRALVHGRVPLFTAACPCSRRAASKVPSLLFTRGASCRLFTGGGLIRVRVSSRRREDLSQLAVPELAPPVLIPFAEEFVNRLLGYIEAKGGHGSVELGAAYLPIGCNQRSSGVIRGHQGSSGVIRAHQGSSGPISAHQCSSVLIRAHPGSSGRIKAKDRAWFGVHTRFTLGSHSEVLTCPSPSASQLAISGNRRQSLAISSNHLPIAIRVPAAEEVEHARRVRPKRVRELLSNYGSN